MYIYNTIYIYIYIYIHTSYDILNNVYHHYYCVVLLCCWRLFKLCSLYAICLGQLEQLLRFA